MIINIYFNHLEGDEDVLLAANEEQKEECIVMLNSMGLEITHICEDEPIWLRSVLNQMAML